MTRQDWQWRCMVLNNLWSQIALRNRRQRRLNELWNLWVDRQIALRTVRPDPQGDGRGALPEVWGVLRGLAEVPPHVQAMTMRAVEGAPGATWPEGGGYHAADGLFFTRLADGGVLVRRYEEHFEGAEPTFTVTFTPETWASVVTEMEAGGETAESWQAAVKRQTGEP